MLQFIIGLALLSGVDTPQHLQDISVTVVAGSGSGSGVLKTRQRDKDTINFVWTAHHVVNGLRRTQEVIDPKTGSTRSIIEYNDAKIVKDLVEDGRTVGKTEMFAKIICVSKQHDLALLQVRKKNFVSASTQFYLEPTIPPIGTRLFHVGSLLGQMGSNSMTAGIISQHGRLYEEMIYDQTTVTAFPGSSGGGVFLEDGRYIGMLTRGAGETFNLIVPVRRIQSWAKSVNVEWAIDDSVAVPSDEELQKIPIEDIGIKFEAKHGPAGSIPPQVPMSIKFKQF